MMPLWKFIETHESKILQTETLNGQEIYRIQVKYPYAESLILWISPEKGFRLMKLQRIWKKQNDDPIEGSLMKKGMYYLTEHVLQYKEYQPDLWFPEKIAAIIYPLLKTDPRKKGNPIMKNTLQTIEFKINADVSASFQLDVPDDTPIYDYGIGKEFPYSELKNPQQ